MTRRILIVEDQEDNRQIMSDLLTNAGFEVSLAVNGRDGVDQATENPPDLILMDIQLPGLDGFEATRQIKNHPACAAIPVIAVTSYALSDDKDRARDVGCDDYLAKPLTPRDLLQKVRGYLG